MSLERFKKVVAQECLDFITGEIHGHNDYQANLARLGAVLVAFGAKHPEAFADEAMGISANIKLEELLDCGLITSDDLKVLRYDEIDTTEKAVSDEKEVV